MRKKIISIFIMLLVVVPLVVYAYSEGVFQVQSTSAHNVGDFNVEWGVPDGQPIFIVANMFPGDVQERTVKIKNTGSALRSVGAQGVKTFESLDYSNALQLVIYEGTNFYYGAGSPTGPKTLKQFFTESATPNGVKLFDLNGNSQKTVKFKVTFDPSAGNQYENAKVVFDITIGIFIEVPAQCVGINIQKVIYGTHRNDHLEGTNGNDLIYGFEGNDKIDGKKGQDCIIAGTGNDTVKAKGHNDIVYGDDGNDYLEGGEGSDKLFGGKGDDEIEGDKGDDYIEGNEGKDNMKGNDGADILLGGTEFDKANGGSGRDRCEAESRTSCEL